MSLERPPSALPGVRYGAVARMADARGAFRELWRADAFAAIEPGDAGADPATVPTFVQANLSTSALVSAGYGSGNTLMGGLAVVGPTRMDYPGTMAAVRAVARYVGEIVAGR